MTNFAKRIIKIPGTATITMLFSITCSNVMFVSEQKASSRICVILKNKIVIGTFVVVIIVDYLSYLHNKKPGFRIC
jgi:hypothetical protein